MVDLAPRQTLTPSGASVTKPAQFTNYSQVTPVSKELFINLLDAGFNLAATIPEKIEGLAWGPDLPDGRHLLYVISDNDLTPSLATELYAFAVEPALINFQPQLLPGPLYPPGQGKESTSITRG